MECKDGVSCASSVSALAVKIGRATKNLQSIFRFHSNRSFQSNSVSHFVRTTRRQRARFLCYFRVFLFLAANAIGWSLVVRSKAYHQFCLVTIRVRDVEQNAVEVCNANAASTFVSKRVYTFVRLTGDCYINGIEFLAARKDGRVKKVT